MIAIYVLGYLYAFFLAYILTMGVYRAHLSGKLLCVTTWLCVPVVVVGYLMDVACNLVIAPFIFLDAPKEWLVTDRLKRYIANGDNWRTKLAESICNNLLDVFDPSDNHC